MTRRKFPPSRKTFTIEPPKSDREVKIWVNGEDHDRLVELLKHYPVPGGTHRGKVSALFRSLETMIIQDWSLPE